MTEAPDAKPEDPGPSDFDSPWKEAIDAFFEPFMALFFPRVHALIDWSQPYEFLDGELQRITGDSAAVVALAQLAAHRRASGPERKARKAEIIALLYRYGYERDTARKLLRFVDWLIRLPRPLELALQRDLSQFEEQTKMSYVTSWERFAREEGLQQGEARALQRLLKLKFGPLDPDLSARVQTAEPAQLEVWLDRVLTATDPGGVFDPR